MCNCKDHEHRHDPETEREPEPGGDLDVRVEPHGPDATRLAESAATLLAHPSLRAHLDGTEHRLLSLRLADDDGEGKRGTPCPPERFVAVVYDYTNNRVVEASGHLADADPAVPGDLDVRILGHQPLPSNEEFAAAVEVVRRDRELRARLDAGELQAYRPMPPVLARERPDGRVERTLNVGLRSTSEDRPHHEFVGVGMFDHQVLRGIDDVVRASERVCEPPPGNDDCPSTGTAGQVWVTVTQAGRVLWRFLALRPAASSGTNGSGVELRYVDYRGKRVLYRAHVPILNVEYQADGVALGCGPTYRDWLDSEACFQAIGPDVVPGIRHCTVPAKTILDSGTDAGNFRGMAIYVAGQEVVLVSEMRAGWYRYVSEWRLHANGTIRPRFGFAGTQNPCTCHTHTHHVYWRFDFDIRTAGHNTVEEYNNPPIVGGSNWHTKTFEIQRPKSPAHQRRWRVRNTQSGEAYTLVPGPTDGGATPYGAGDLWVLRYRGNEIDDGQGFTTTPALSREHLEKFMSPPEPVTDTDVVLWYAAHFLHDDAHESGAKLGPDLVPSGW